MSTDLSLRCRCGEVRGVVSGVSSRSGNLVVCYCKDCQAFARFLGQPDIVDALGGTRIFQTAPSRVRIAAGLSSVACVRLSDEGMHRFYAACCRTPLANTVGRRSPFVGLIVACLDATATGRALDDVLGEPMAYGYGRDAVGGCPPHAPPTLPVGFLVRASLRMLRWLVTGKTRRFPFLDPTTGRLPQAPKVLGAAERAALEPGATASA